MHGDERVLVVRLDYGWRERDCLRALSGFPEFGIESCIPFRSFFQLTSVSSSSLYTSGRPSDITLN